MLSLTRVLTAAALTACLVTAGRAREPAAPAFLENGVTAHRGYSAKYPENTLEAFRRGIAAGADWLECDCFTTRDGRLVVIHDATTGRVGDRDLRVGEVTYEQLRQVDVAHQFRLRNRLSPQQCPPARVPLLKELLELVIKQDKTRLSIQPKDECTADAVALVRSMRATAWVGFNDGSLPKMRLVKELDPAIPVFWDRGPDTDVDADCRVARQHGFEAVVPHHRGVTREKVEAIHKAGLRAGAWTVNDPQEMRRLLDLGIDRIYTDDPALLLRVKSDGREQ